jgi:hypothetical protein
VKRKKLERLDTYIAPLLEAKGQLVRVGRVMRECAAAAAAISSLQFPAFSSLLWDAGSDATAAVVALPLLVLLCSCRAPSAHATPQLPLPSAVQDAGEARQLLRSGVFAGLRDNVRSLGEYASQRAGDDSGRELVRGFFKELEGFDSELRKAQREGAGVEEARKRLDGTVAALER